MNKEWEKYLDRASPYDHEELEAEYYARRSSGGILGLMVLGLLLAVALLVLVIKLLWFGI